MITGFVQGQVLRLSAPVVAADTLDYLTAQFVFRSADWSGMEKWAHFAKGGTVYDIPLTDDKIRREDHLNLAAGEWKVYVHGNRFEGGKVVERITTAEDVLCVVPTGALNGEPFPEMPASVTEQILARLENVEQNGGGGSGGGITNETDPTVPAWAKEPDPPKYTAADVGALAADDLPAAINTALAQAKASGEFDGEPGRPGDPGRGIVSVVRTAGTGAAGTVDTYTITYTDGTTGTIAVYNGKDGTPYVLTAADKSAIAAEAAGLVNVPVLSVNGKTGAVLIDAGDVNADPAGTASGAVTGHNVSEAAHNDIRLLITGLTSRLNAIANSTDEDLDQLAEIVTYIKANKSLIDSITTSKVSVTDIIDNLTTSVSNKPLSAKMGVQLKALIDAIKIPTSLPASDVYSWAKQPQKPTYTASEVGAATAQQAADLSEAIADKGVTPQMFGAVGDGVSDDTSAINNALASGKNVFFPAGTYKITSALIMPSGASISGVAGLSVIKSYITSGYVLNGAGGSTTLSSPNIENLTFENGNTQDATTKLISGNFMYKATSMFMQNCRVKKYFNVFDAVSNDSFIYNCRFTAIYNSFMRFCTDSVIDGNYINASRYGFPHHTKTFSGGFNSTSFINNLVDYFYTIFGVSEMASATITSNVFNRSVNVFHDTITHATISNNIFTGIQSESVDLTVLTAEQIAELEAEKWSVIKFDNNAVSATNHVMAINSFTNNMGYDCQYYFYIADGVQVIPADCEFRGNQISSGAGNKLSAVDVGFRNTATTESSYNSMQNCYFDFWDMKEYDALPSATLIGNTAKSVVSFPYMKAICNKELYTNINGVWVKDGQNSESEESQDTGACILFVDDESAFADKSKVYVLPDGALYTYMEREITVEDGTPKFTNIKDQCYIRYGEQFSESGGGFKASTSATAIAVPVPVGSTSVVVRFKGVTRSSNLTALYGATSIEALNSADVTQFGTTGISPDENGVYNFTVTKANDTAYLLFHMNGTKEEEFTNMIVTVNEPIEYTVGTETIIQKGFIDTGYKLITPDGSNNLDFDALVDAVVDALPVYNGGVS